MRCQVGVGRGAEQLYFNYIRNWKIIVHISNNTILDRTYRALLSVLSRWCWFCLGPGPQSGSSALPAFGGRNTLGLGREVYSSFFFSDEVANVTDT